MEVRKKFEKNPDVGVGYGSSSRFTERVSTFSIFCDLIQINKVLLVNLG